MNPNSSQEPSDSSREPSRRPGYFGHKQSQKGPKGHGQPRTSRHPQNDGRKRPQSWSKSRQQPRGFPFFKPPVPDSGILVVAFLAESSLRALMQTPRIESRGFFHPSEIREGHKFLVAESRRSYEQTLRDVPDIETRDLEKIVKKDLEKAISERFGRLPTIIAAILVA